MKKKMEEKKKKIGHYIGLTLLEVTLVAIFCLIIFEPVYVFGVIGDPNATQQSLLDIGNSAPVIKNISIEDPISLTPNATKTVVCSAIIEEYFGETDLKNASAEFFDLGSGKSFGSLDDNNDHYTNSSCYLNLSYGDAYTAEAICSFEVEYYANPGNWNCTVQVYDNSDFDDIKSNTTSVQTLLALSLPDSIDYGLVNATGISDEVVANVTNLGNVEINLSIEGYAQTEGDGNAMNCSVGSNEFFIQDDYEKYNFTTSNPGTLSSLAQFEVNYTNVTSDAVFREFNLASRTNDLVQDERKETYWRIYVPVGVAGTCEGNLIFGATQAPGA